MFTATVALLSFALLVNIINGDSENTDRFIIACHTTDFECFKRQYRSLRDTVLLGSLHFAIDYYKPYLFKYGNSGTCIKLSGLEESDLVAISMDSDSKEYLLTLELPLRIHQVSNKSNVCVKPDVEFLNIEPHIGPYRSFDGNATIKVTFPYELRKRKGETYLLLKEEDLDVILDIPDLRPPGQSSAYEGNHYEISEWAYEAVEHIDAARYFALPYTTNIRLFTSTVPLHNPSQSTAEHDDVLLADFDYDDNFRLLSRDINCAGDIIVPQVYLLLYPEEEYSELKFSFYDTD